MRKYRRQIVIVIVVVAGLAGLFLVSLGYYPIAIVNGIFITARTFTKDYGAASMYYANYLKIYRFPGSDAAPLSSDDIARAVMDQLIENALAAQGAEKEAGSDLENLVNEKINEAVKNSQLENAAKTLYGLSLDDFKNEVLKPQAERDILTGRLFLKGQNIDTWLADAKKSARVIFFSGRFRWNGTEVVNGK